jgi:acyl dehydratase
MGVNYGCEKVRFPAAVPVDSRIRGGGEIISAEEVKGSVQVVVRMTIEIESGERPACVLDTISRFFP